MFLCLRCLHLSTHRCVHGPAVNLLLPRPPRHLGLTIHIIPLTMLNKHQTALVFIISVLLCWLLLSGRKTSVEGPQWHGRRYSLVLLGQLEVLAVEVYEAGGK
jgi:hypothetical protein